MRKDKYCIELTEEYIKKNCDEIICLLRSIGREGIELSILMRTITLPMQLLRLVGLGSCQPFLYSEIEKTFHLRIEKNRKE